MSVYISAVKLTDEFGRGRITLTETGDERMCMNVSIGQAAAVTVLMQGNEVDELIGQLQTWRRNRLGEPAHG